VQADEADALARQAHALAERQRDLARAAGALSSKKADVLKELAEAQRGIEDDARRLALEVDAPLAENGRGRLNTGVIRDAVEPIERGDLDQARQRLEGAEVELRRLARDLADVPADPRAIAQRLARRQDALASQVNEALRPFQGKSEPSDEEKAARAAALEPLAGRQQAIARLAAAIALVAPAGSKKAVGEEALRTAQRSTEEAAEVLRHDAAPAREITAQQARAQAVLNRLAAILPDPSVRRAEARRPLEEARRLARDAERELDRILRETEPRSGKPFDPARAAAERARRLESPSQKQAKLADALAAIDAGSGATPQQQHAVQRARALAEALAALRTADGSVPRKEDARAALGGLQAEARAALDRLEQKLAGRVPAADLAAELAADQRALGDRLARPDDLPAAADEERRIATALRNLEAPDAPEAKAEAERLAEQAAAALHEPGADPKTAIRAAAAAAEALAARLARGSDPAEPATAAVPAPADPELGLTPAETAAAEQLARRERQLRERLQTMLAERIAPQQDLRAEAVALGGALADLRDQVLSDRARGPAQEAARALAERAPQAMDQGTDRLAQGQAAAARDALRQAAALIEGGAQQAEDLAAALRTERPPDPAPGSGSGAALATARAAMRQAAEQLAQGQPEAAQQAMQQSARDLRAAAERGTGPGAATTASQPAPGSDQESDRGDPGETLARQGTPDLTELKATIARTTGRTWGELPGHLRTEILQMSQGRYRDEYARLIQLYFQEIAAGAGRSHP
jgi:hypothetical protein